VPPDRERYELMKRYYLMLQEHGESDAVGKMKQFATYFHARRRNGGKLRTEIYRAHEVTSILDKWMRFFRGAGGAARECAEVA
jgi:tRNA-dihydrouridine synthase B